MSKSKETTQSKDETISTTRHYVRVVAFVVFGVSLCTYLMVQVYPYLEISPIVFQRPAEEGNTENAYALSRELPVRLQVPKLGIDTTFVPPLELDAVGAITVPDSYEEVGWYKLGASPGEIGTASILGHVDSYEGPAVFFPLGQLAAGDQIIVTRADTTEAIFEVEYLERYPQDEFPNEKVYSATPYPSLRLITCSGVYQKGVQRYTHNLVVYARLVTPPGPMAL